MIGVDEMLARFERVRRLRDNEWMAACPAHDDRNPSLHLTLKPGDCWLLHDHAGCAREVVMLEARLGWDDLFAERANGKREIVETYDYVDENGALLFQAVRYWPKHFNQRQPDGKGGWVWSINKPRVRRVLYRLPKLIEAVKAGRRVWIVAGEKDVHALERAREVASCNPMGEGPGKWRKEYTETLRGAEVVVIADRDEEGHGHASRVVKALDGVAASVEVREAVVGKDASDHLAAGKTVDEFEPVGIEPVVFDFSQAVPDDVPPDGDAPLDPDVAALIVDMGEAVKQAHEPIAYVIDRMAALGVLTEIIGRHSSLKSWLCMLLAAGAHQGKSKVAGFDLAHAPALYVDAENGWRVMGRRFKAAGIPEGGLVMADGAALDLPRRLDLLERLIVQTGAKLIVLDSLRRLAPNVREKDSDDMAPLVGALGELARRLDVAIVLIHHRSSKRNAADSRGSSSIEDQADVAFKLDRHRDADRIALTVLKYRIDAEPPTRWLRFGKGEDGIVVFTAPDAARERPAEDESGAEDDLKRRIRKLADQVRQDGGWSPTRLAIAVGSSQRNGTFQAALGQLLGSGEWGAEGSTRARKLRPSDSRDSRDPLGDGVNRANGEDDSDGAERLFDAPPIKGCAVHRGDPQPGCRYCNPRGGGK